MLFNSLEYFLFFAFVFIYQWYIHPILFGKSPNKQTYLHSFLLVVSYVFYMSWDYRFGALIFISTVIDYYLAILIESDSSDKRRFRFLQISLVLNLVVILGFFKYYNFFIGNINSGFSLFGFNPPLPVLKIILPVGISFFTFQSMSYTIDVYRKEISVEKSFIRFALFVSFFPQLVAGPIVTARTFLPQLLEEKKLEMVRFLPAIRYFFLGYVKKVIISDNVSPIVDLIFKNPENYGTGASWLAAFLFIVQIYCDFSGYSDMAYGSALLLGYELPENFRMPFIGANFTELWRRWHISLSGWLRDYLYIGLGGSRCSYLRHKFNLFFTMLLAGLWHGASWNFVIWGSIQGVILAAESAYKKWKDENGIKKQNPILLNFFFILCTSVFFVIIGTLFRSESLTQEWIMIKRMFWEFSDLGLRPYMLKIGIPAILAVCVGQIFGYYIFERNKKIPIPAILEFAFYILLVPCISILTSDNTAPFIYFQF